MNYLFSLLFLFFSLSLQSQVLTRTSNDLSVNLPDASEELAAFKDARNVNVKLLEKTKDEDGLTCSGQKSWKLVSILEGDVKDRYRFDNQPLGVYKVVMTIPLSYSSTKIKIAKIYESNVLNEKIDANSELLSLKSEEIISIYPNPSAEKIWVDVQSNDTYPEENFTIQIINGTGQLMKEIVNLGKNLETVEIDLSDYPAGQYTVVVLKNHQIFASQKIAKITK